MKGEKVNYKIVHLTFKKSKSEILKWWKVPNWKVSLSNPSSIKDLILYAWNKNRLGKVIKSIIIKICLRNRTPAQPRRFHKNNYHN